MFWLLLFLSVTSLATEEQDCANIICSHDGEAVCGLRGGGSQEVTFKLFQDACDLQKYGCLDETKGFKLVNIKYCQQAIFLNTKSNSVNNGIAEENSIAQIEMINGDIREPSDLTADTKGNVTCIKCDCNAASETICAIRAVGGRFVVRWFPDKCHMLQYNCDKNVSFSVTDDNICAGANSLETAKDAATENTGTTEEMQNTDIESEKLDTAGNPCIINDCVSNSKVICGIRLEENRFIIRWFNDECDMLKYNCENHVKFIITDDFICVGNDSFEVFDNSEQSKIVETDYITEAIDTTTLLEVSGSGETGEIEVTNEEDYKTEKTASHVKRSMPQNVVVSTFDITGDINKTVDEFFAASHTTGIQLKKLENKDTRRVIVQNTGPVNYFVPRTFIPANYTPVEDISESEDHPEYTPLVRYCYHKCPTKCPEYYKPVCAARITDEKMTPFLFFKNHCYMDIAKCILDWQFFEDQNHTFLEEMGFVFCGGYKIMNTMYMFPLVRILQKMGRLKKKGKIRFVMRNLGQFSDRLFG